MQGSRTEHHPTIDEVDCYELPKKLGLFQEVDSGNDMTTDMIIDRIIDHKFDSYFRIYAVQAVRILFQTGV